MIELSLYDGVIPKRCEDSTKGTLLAKSPLAKPPLATELTLMCEGYLSYFRIADSDGKCFCQGSLGTNGDIQILIRHVEKGHMIRIDTSSIL